MIYLPVIFLLFFNGINTPLSDTASTPGNTVPPKDSITPPKDSIAKDSIMPVKKLYDAFKENETAAKEKYAGKNILVTGFVVYVGPDVYALPSVEISEKKGGKSRALCVLPFSDYLKLRKVSKGEQVIIKGEVRGFYSKGDQVIVKECSIQEKVNPAQK